MLARAERDAGLGSWAVIVRQNRFGYPTDEVLLGAHDHRMQLEFKRLRLLFRIWRDFDIIHFNSGQTLMPQRVRRHPEQYSPRLLAAYHAYVRLVELRDLPILKAMGKGIVVTYQGDDARQDDYCLAHFAINAVNHVEPGYNARGSDAHKRKRIARIATYADRIYALNPDLLHVLPPPARFLPYASVDPRAWPVDETPRAPDAPPVVLHAPSHRGVKGTRFVLDAVRRLEAEGIPFKFLLVEGLSHAEAKALYPQADLLVDQLLLGWYGALAVELMALGKPVICYLREDDLRFLPAGMRAELPVINATPESLYAVLKLWLTERRAGLAELGRRGRAYVERWHDPQQIARQLKGDYEEILAGKQPKR